MHAQSFLDELLRLLELVGVEELFGLDLKARDISEYADFHLASRASLRCCSQILGPRLCQSLYLLVCLLRGYISDPSCARTSIIRILREAKSFVSSASASLAECRSLCRLLKFRHDLLLLASYGLLMVGSANPPPVLRALHGHVVPIRRLNALHETLHRPIWGHCSSHHRVWGV